MRLLFCLMGLSLWAACLAQDGIGTRNHRANSLLFLRFEPAGKKLGKGESSFTFGYVNANDFRVVGPIFEDYEIWRLSGKYSRGIDDQSEWGMEIPLVWRGRGMMDEIIDWWHANVLQWGATSRDLYPAYASRLFWFGVYDKGSAFGLGDVSVYFRRELCNGLSMRLGVELPTGSKSELLGSGGIDVGASIDYQKQLSERWFLNLQFAVVLQNGNVIPNVRDSIDQESASVVYIPNSKDQWILQWQSEKSPNRTGISVADGVHSLVSFGYRRKLDDNKDLTLYFSEDKDLFNDSIPALANIAPDFTFGVSYRIRL